MFSMDHINLEIKDVKL
jgi:hypothetical protein